MYRTNHRLAATLAAAVLPASYAVPALAGTSTTGTTAVVADTTTAAPDNNGSFSTFSSPALNDAGQAAFRGVLIGTSGGFSDNRGVFRGDGTTLTQVARGGQAAPDGNGSFLNFSSPALNEAGQAAFRGDIDLNDGGSAFDDTGIFRGDGMTLTQIAREGQAAPDGNGTFSIFFDPALNDAGQAAFRAFLTGTGGGSSDDGGIFRGDGTTLTRVAREGQAAPTSDGMLEGVLSRLFNPALNDVGQLAFVANIDLQDGGSTLDEGGLFFYDDLLGLTSVARTGDAFDGSTITGLSFSSGSIQQDEGGGLNNLGQVAYDYDLADGRRGVAVWSIPEPGVAMTGLALLSLATLRRRAASA